MTKEKKVNAVITATIAAMMFVIVIAFTQVSSPPPAWEDDIHNINNQEYVWECAIENNCTVENVTQAMFNERYWETLKETP